MPVHNKAPLPPPLTNAVQSVQGHRFKCSTHHGILLQNLVEVVHGQGIQAAVGVSTDAGCAPPSGQQAYLYRVQTRQKIIET